MKTSREKKLKMKCLKVGCPFDTDERILATSSQADKLAVLRLHVDTTHLMGGQEQAGTIASTQVHAERMQKPKLVTSDGMVAEEDGNFLSTPGSSIKLLLRSGLTLPRPTCPWCWVRSPAGCSTEWARWLSRP